MRRFVRFAGVAVLTVVFAIGGYWIIQQAYQGQPTTDLRPLATQACARPVGPAQRTDCVQLAAAVSADDSADLSRLALLLSLASTIVAALGAVVVVRSLSHSRRAIEASTDANRIATEATEAQNRAWLSFEVTDTRLTSVTGNLELGGFISFICHGATPARDVAFCPWLTFGDPATSAQHLRNLFETGQIEWTHGAVFPGKTMPDRFTVQATDSPSDWGRPSLILAASYRTAFSDKQRFSAVAWTIYDIRRDGGAVHPMRPPGQSAFALRPSDTFAGIVT